jgi:hypothetical protein
MDFNSNPLLLQIKNHKNLVLESKQDLSLTKILNSDRCQSILSKCRVRDRIYTPVRTIFSFIKQVLNADKSCKKVVNDVVVEFFSQEGKNISSSTGPYCKARKRISEETVQDLVKVTGEMASEKSKLQWRPYGRELKVTDGSTAKMADTKANQKEYPQVKNQKEGLGFPIVRFVVVMSLTIGVVLNYAFGAYSGKGTGESSLLRSIFDCVKKDDILLGDRYFPNFFLMCDLKRIGADGIFRGHSQRHYDFRAGIRLGKNDHITKWKRPAKPEWMTEEEYSTYPNEVEVREFKVNGNVYVTTFLKSKKYHKKELARIYERRWEVEINLKSIKSIMNMDFLSCKTPAMVRKEIGVHFLAYNFIRIIIAEACGKYNALPWKISFKGSVQLIHSFMPHFINSSEQKNKTLYVELLRLIIKNKIGNRPGRVEPRAVKRRPKAFPSLSKPRSVERIKLMKKIEKIISRNATA